jgi:hypothetical protein
MTIRKYPYGESLQRLEKQGFGPLVTNAGPDLSQGYHILLTCIGGIVQNGSREQKATLLATLRQSGRVATPSNLPQNGSMASDAGQKDLRDAAIGKAEGSGDFSALGLGQYSMVLKETGDQRGFVPEYVVQHISSFPPSSRPLSHSKDSRSRAQRETRSRLGIRRRVKRARISTSGSELMTLVGKKCARYID